MFPRPSEASDVLERLVPPEGRPCAHTLGPSSGHLVKRMLLLKRRRLWPGQAGLVGPVWSVVS